MNVQRKCFAQFLHGTAPKAGWRRPFLSGLRQTGSYTVPAPVYHRHFEPGHLQFITPSTYHRVPIFSTPSFCRLFVEAFRAVRSKLDFLLVGSVLMPEHFHLLFQPWPAESTPRVMKELKQRSAHAILAASVARTCFVGPRLWFVAEEMPRTLDSRSALPCSMEGAPPTGQNPAP